MFKLVEANLSLALWMFLDMVLWTEPRTHTYAVTVLAFYAVFDY